MATKGFGKLLREHRERAERSMGELARHLGVSVAYLSDVERGHRPPLVNDKIQLAATFLNISDSGPLMRAAAEARGAFHLDARVSNEHRTVGAALARQWGAIPDSKLERIRALLEEEEEE